ncbi:hypothetical protein [Rhizobium sp. FKL33]|uniref:hypothetical protein n=1 Tax=Rhizobium sp. FKL33 TaxID=2562307 RepID=UPI0010C14C6E|nr:hypothetical protein [Rhizobium sp. FKL33]
MTMDLNERRMKALTGAFDRAIQTMIANANAAGWSTDEALAAMGAAVANLKMSNLIDPDPADDPEPYGEDQSIEDADTEEAPDLSDDHPHDHFDEEGPRRRSAEGPAYAPTRSAVISERPANE